MTPEDMKAVLELARGSMASEQAMMSVSQSLGEISESMQKIAAAEENEKEAPPAINVNVPQAAPPVINVQPAAVTVMEKEEREIKAWELEVTSRDGNGNIRKAVFTAIY